MRFENPAVFQQFWIVAVAFGIWLFFQLQLRRRRLKKMKPTVFEYLARNQSPVKKIIKVILRFSAMVFVMIALARPQLGIGVIEVKSQGFEIMLLVDVSNSMLSDDVKPSRLEIAKKDLEKLVDLLPGNRIGLVGFAGSAALMSPLTNDPAALKMYIDSLSPDVVSSQGTDFREALNQAETAFERGGVSSSDEVRVSRVILLVSDGEDHEAKATEKVKELKAKGISVFSVAYGTEKGGPIPERDQMGYLKGYKKDNSGQTIITTVNTQSLQFLAQTGGGQFYFSTLGGDHIKQLVKDFEEQEKSDFASSTATKYEEKYQYFLFIAFLLLLFDLFLSERRQIQLPRRRFVANSVIFLIVAGISLLNQACQKTDQVEAVFHNRDAEVQITKKDFSAAANSFGQAVALDPQSGVHHLNLGVISELMKKTDTATMSYKSARDLGDKETRFMAYFNLGRLLATSGAIDDALASYQKALEIKPDSIETKVNIELLITQEKEKRDGEGHGKGGKGKGKKNDDPNEDQDKKDDEKKEYAPNEPQPGEKPPEDGEISPSDRNKILKELERQDKKIRNEYNKGERKETPNEQDW